MIAAIDSASTDLSVALVGPAGTPIGLDAWSTQARAGDELLPRLLRLLREAGQGLHGLRGIGIGLGPGSFTGLRVGMSLAKGLALALEIPIVGVPSLPAWLEAEPEASAAVTRAGAREAYRLARGDASPRLVDRDELSVPDGGRLVVPLELVRAFDLDPHACLPPRRAALAIGAAAARRLGQGQAGDDLARLEPAYLRAPRGIGQVHHPEAG